MKPNVLLVSTRIWFATARLAMAFADFDTGVSVVVPRGHPIAGSSVLSRTHIYYPFIPLLSISRAIDLEHPDFIVPCDDLALEHLQTLYDHAVRIGPEGAKTRLLLEFSLGNLSTLSAGAKSAFMALAQEEKVRTPSFAQINTTDELKTWIRSNGLPAVLKVDKTTSGEGVRFVHTLDEAERTFRALHRPLSFVRAAKRAVIDLDPSFIVPSMMRKHPVITAQEFIGGPDANSTVACWKGKVLANISVQVLQTTRPMGPASVVRLIDNPEMTAASEAMVRRLGLSGICGFDFVIDQRTGGAYLLEINQRATQNGHLRLGPGRDLCAALVAGFSGRSIIESPSVTDNDLIAYFPQELLRDPTSEFLKTAHHDVPWDEPNLLQAALAGIRKKNPSFRLERGDSKDKRPTAVDYSATV